ncbi:hypothetical protein BZ13_1135 [Francisella philomiragia subsp. philomiragia ATCC 25015]|uniref:hypothetical protein n=1 Tax=Francisella philomiragia TaxID=28110 RepID=UPI0005A56150|nr:hypothetical protein [Francisella philomiragia]AJI75752.1 hypothetical protein BZ13_1135 [Francisella philomiragia subsp. philomiragia ATCC 25015]
MKKTSLVVVALFTSTLALATPFTLNIDNQSEAQGLQLHSSTDGDKNLEKRHQYF